jgi:bifunctional DNA-binding transcriptional regulator/antitoxin component of YhaV-PrlF toxin-antitoxin module
MSKKSKNMYRRVSPKNQVAIPVFLMKKFDIAPRSTITFSETKDGILIQPAEDPLQKVRGMWKGLTEKSALEIHREFKKEEREIEERKWKKLGWNH